MITKLRINSKLWIVNNDKGKALIRYGKGLTCPTHIFTFVEYRNEKVICPYCGEVYNIEGFQHYNNNRN